MPANKFATALFFLTLFMTPAVSDVSESHSLVSPPSQSAPLDIQIVKGVVSPGSTASSLLAPYLPLKTIYAISRRSNDIFPLSRLRKGQPYKIFLQEGQLIGFEYRIDRENKLVIEKKNKQFSIQKAPLEYNVKTETISAVITSSLFEAVRKSGEEIELAWKLADIFAWDIDFIRDIRAGDRFQVLVEKKYHEGNLLGYGKVEAAFFTNKGRTFKAFLHEDSNGVQGYYDENGDSLQKAFLKAPLAFSRISSTFTLKRMHPLLKKYRPHPAIDYAAPIGTPVKSVGDGVIQRFGYSKSMGNFMVIRHCGGYTTRYYHMNKFARSMKRNRKIAQGEVIGYVGMTGYATGPHLCFRMIRNGNPVNPLTYKCPSGAPVSPREMDRFLARTEILFKKMIAAADPSKETAQS
ncbi:M23 family metallopeptidase [Desulfospira joergensenii]|uniref:M23 family metallopeptidase n=1 Tax=Desulfospira joergensenii TaxID=53329 RepID=UPI00041F0E23|nr:peptidoglycan DD-metalloendopeptidase family protein [Desulfospira joergensenii]